MRINRISENLRLIQNDITHLAGQEPDLSEEEPMGPADVQALRKVKSSVDHLRQVLRTYIDYASSHVDGPDSEEFQQARSHRTTLILRYACEGLRLRELQNREVPASIFDQLIAMAISTVDRHQHPVPEYESEMLEAVAD